MAPPLQMQRPNPSPELYAAMCDTATHHGDRIDFPETFDEMITDGNDTLASHINVLQGLIAHVRESLLIGEPMGVKSNGLAVLLTGPVGTGKTHLAKATTAAITKPVNTACRLAIESEPGWKPPDAKLESSKPLGFLVSIEGHGRLTCKRDEGGESVHCLWQPPRTPWNDEVVEVLTTGITGKDEYSPGATIFRKFRLGHPTSDQLGERFPENRTVGFPPDGLVINVPLSVRDGVFFFGDTMSVERMMVGPTLQGNPEPSVRPMVWVFDDLGRLDQQRDNEHGYWNGFIRAVEMVRQTGSLMVCTSNLGVDEILDSIRTHLGKIDSERMQSRLDEMTLGRQLVLECEGPDMRTNDIPSLKDYFRPPTPDSARSQ